MKLGEREGWRNWEKGYAILLIIVTPEEGADELQWLYVV